MFRAWLGLGVLFVSVKVASRQMDWLGDWAQPNMDVVELVSKHLEK